MTLPVVHPILSSLHPHQLEADIAFELIDGLLAGVRIVLALAGLAQMARHQEAAGAVVHFLGAALLDEDAGDRGLAGLRLLVLALPAFTAEPRIKEIAQQIGLVAVA